jgi:hypothetical protein
MRLALPLLIVSLLGACGGKTQPVVPEDAVLQQSAHAAGSALSLDRPTEAIAQYERALERARAHDDATAIGDYGYDLAVAQLAANQPKQALASIRTTRAELLRRGSASFPALDLAEAMAEYRLGEKEQSDQLAARAESGTDATAAARASFLRGLIADETGKAAELDAALARLAQPATDDEKADAAELLARRELSQGEFAAATAQAEHAADLRRTVLDYRGIARALSVAAAAQARLGNSRAAAELYMRAGESAAAQGDAALARQWLRRTTELSRDPALVDAARVGIAELNKAPSGPIPGK